MNTKLRTIRLSDRCWSDFKKIRPRGVSWEVMIAQVIIPLVTPITPKFVRKFKGK